MIVQQWLEKAERTIITARAVLPSDPDTACSCAYYAMFYAARAALVHVGQAERAMGKTHRGMIAAFSEHLVSPDLLPEEHGRAFRQAEQDRLEADYTGLGVTADTAAIIVERATALLAAVRNLTAAQAGEAAPPQDH